MNPVAHYHKNGFVICRDILAADRCDQLNAHLETWYAEQQLHANHYGILFHNLHAKIPAFLHLLREGSLQREAERIYGSKLLFFQDNLIWKPPSAKESINWHQDYSYWPLSNPNGITLWLALDDVKEESGCLQFCLYSHHQGECIANDFIANAPAEWAANLPALHIQQENIRDLILAKGSISLHHPLCAHTSGPNSSSYHRRAWSLTFVDPNLKWDFLHAPHPYRYIFSANTNILPKEHHQPLSLCPPPLKEI